MSNQVVEYLINKSAILSGHLISNIALAGPAATSQFQARQLLKNLFQTSFLASTVILRRSLSDDISATPQVFLCSRCLGKRPG